MGGWVLHFSKMWLSSKILPRNCRPETPQWLRLEVLSHTLPSEQAPALHKAQISLKRPGWPGLMVLGLQAVNSEVPAPGNKTCLCRSVHSMPQLRPQVLSWSENGARAGRHCRQGSNAWSPRPPQWRGSRAWETQIRVRRWTSK